MKPHDGTKPALDAGVPPLQFTIRSLLWLSLASGAVMAQAVACKDAGIEFLVPHSSADLAALGCLAVALYLAATRLSSDGALCALALGWTIVLFGLAMEMIELFRVMPFSFTAGGHGWWEEFDRRVPGWIVLRMTIPLLLALPTLALLGNGRHRLPGRSVRWICGCSILATIHVVLLWLATSALYTVRLGQDGRPDWSTLFD